MKQNIYSFISESKFENISFDTKNHVNKSTLFHKSITELKQDLWAEYKKKYNTDLAYVAMYLNISEDILAVILAIMSLL